MTGTNVSNFNFSEVKEMISDVERAGLYARFEKLGMNIPDFHADPWKELAMMRLHPASIETKICQDGTYSAIFYDTKGWTSKEFRGHGIGITPLSAALRALLSVDLSNSVFLRETEAPQRKVGKVIYYDSNLSVLLLKRVATDTNGGLWETPGGGIDEGETYMAGAIRELGEESGADTTNGFFFELAREVMTCDETKEQFNVSFVAGCTIAKTVDLSNNPDHDDYAWVPLNEVFESGLEIDSWTKRHIALWMEKFNK